MNKILPISELKNVLAEAHRLQKRVVFQSGVFDLFHYGHYHALKKASELGDIFVVQIDGNKLVKRRKGPERPLIDEKNRAEVISTLEFVDFVIISNSPSIDVKKIKVINPHVFVRAKKAEETDLARLATEKKIKSISPTTQIYWLEQTSWISTSKIVSELYQNNIKENNNG